MLTVPPRVIKGTKFPGVSPIDLVHHPDFIPNSIFGRSSISPDTVFSSDVGDQASSKYNAYHRSKSPLFDNYTFQYCHLNKKDSVSPQILLHKKPQNRLLSNTHYTTWASSSYSDSKPRVYHCKMKVSDHSDISKPFKESIMSDLDKKHLSKFDFPDFDPDDLV